MRVLAPGLFASADPPFGFRPLPSALHFLFSIRIFFGRPASLLAASFPVRNVVSPPWLRRRRRGRIDFSGRPRSPPLDRPAANAVTLIPPSPYPAPSGRRMVAASLRGRSPFSFLPLLGPVPNECPGDGFAHGKSRKKSKSNIYPASVGKSLSSPWVEEGGSQPKAEGRESGLPPPPPPLDLESKAPLSSPLPLPLLPFSASFCLSCHRQKERKKGGKGEKDGGGGGLSSPSLKSERRKEMSEEPPSLSSFARLSDGV